MTDDVKGGIELLYHPLPPARPHPSANPRAPLDSSRRGTAARPGRGFKKWFIKTEEVHLDQAHGHDRRCHVTPQVKPLPLNLSPRAPPTRHAHPLPRRAAPRAAAGGGRRALKRISPMRSPSMTGPPPGAVGTRPSALRSTHRAAVASISRSSAARSAGGPVWNESSASVIGSCARAARQGVSVQ